MATENKVNELKERAEKLVEEIKDTVSDIAEKTPGVFARLLEALKNIVRAIITWIKGLFS